jgi:hypothetical protein
MTRQSCFGLVVLAAIFVSIAGELRAVASPRQAASATAEAMAAKSNPDGGSKVGSLLAGALK